MGICQLQNCPHYGLATKYRITCYREIQCWRGWLDVMVFLMMKCCERPGITLKSALARFLLNCKQKGRYFHHME